MRLRTGLWAAGFLVLIASGVVAQDASKIELRRIDKAILVPSAEMGEVAVYGWAEPVAQSSNRHRYTYRVTYREGFPAMVPYASESGSGTVPLTGVSIVGDPDCDYQMVATPSRHENGPWTWTSRAGGTLNYDTPSRRWAPGTKGFRFTFTSSCAPARGSVVVRMSNNEGIVEGAYAISAPILAPMRPPVRPKGTTGPAPHGTYANPSRRR